MKKKKMKEIFYEKYKFFKSLCIGIVIVLGLLIGVTVSVVITISIVSIFSITIGLCYIVYFMMKIIKLFFK